MDDTDARLARLGLVAPTRRGFLAGAAGLGVLATLAACGAGGSAASTSTSGAIATGKPKRGGVLKAAIPEEPFPHAYDMAVVGSSTGTERVAYLAYNGLTNVNQNNEIVGELAESIETPTPTRYIFNLRKGVTFLRSHPVTEDQLAAPHLGDRPGEGVGSVPGRDDAHAPVCGVPRTAPPYEDPDAVADGGREVRGK
jgi:hypothetical protein